MWGQISTSKTESVHITMHRWTGVCSHYRASKKVQNRVEQHPSSSICAHLPTPRKARTEDLKGKGGKSHLLQEIPISCSILHHCSVSLPWFGAYRRRIAEERCCTFGQRKVGMGLFTWFPVMGYPREIPRENVYGPLICLLPHRKM